MKFLALLISIATFFTLSAQNPNDALVSFSGGVVSIKNMPEKTINVKGSVYQYDEWSLGNLLMKSGETLKAYPLKYDLKYSRYEIKDNETVKVLSLMDVKEASWMLPNGNAEHYINSSEFEHIGYHGMFKVITTGKLTLLKSTSLRIEESYYNPALDVGSNERKYVKKSTYYVMTNGKLTPIKTTRKSILKQFGDQSDTVNKWVKENTLKYNNDTDLAKIFNYYHSL